MIEKFKKEPRTSVVKKGDIMLKRVTFLISMIIPLLILANNPAQVIFNYNNGVPAKITVIGATNEIQWLGISLYPLKFQDAIKEGHHIIREISKGNFQEEIVLDSNLAKQYNVSYEIALWGKRVSEKNCKIKDCYWCKTNGFHLDDIKFYTSGYFNTITKK